MKEVLGPGENPDLNGQMAEVRLWAGERTVAEIQANVFQRLTGREPRLLGLWNFADGTARDASLNGRDARLGGAAKIIDETLPTAGTLAPWSRLIVRLTDENRSLAEGVTLRAFARGVELTKRTNLWNGVYPLTIFTDAEFVDLEVTGPGVVGA